jgi:hypothetical protein
VSSSDGPARIDIGVLRQRATLARQRATWCSARASHHDALAAIADESLQKVHLRLGELHRQAEIRHRTSAAIHDLLASQLHRWRDPEASAEPRLMRSVASQLGMSSALAALGHKDGATAVVVAASDETARVAHDLELVMAEGPATEAARGAPVRAAGQALCERWPRYGPAVGELGVQAVCAAPLRSRSRGLGVLCGYGRVPATSQQTLTATRLMADVLTEALIGTIDLAPEKDSLCLAFLDESDHQSTVHQAAGMLSVQYGCQVEDAADLLAARAFADGKPVQEIALGVVQGEELLS